MSQLLQNALYGTVMILAVAVLRRTLKERLVPEARLALWAVCLFRLLTPAAPESALSLWGLSRLFEAHTPAAPAPAPQLYILPQAAPAPQPAPGISWETALFAAWLAASGLLAVRYVLSWRRTRRAVACAIPLDRDDPRYAPLPKCARLREGPMEGAPLTFGVIRPTVVLSPGLDAAELDCVLAHEGTHASRRDNLWHYAMALALAVHWWNPAVWVMARLLRRDVELSCDRAALKKLGADRRADYANALVTLATQAEGPAFCQTFGRKAAEERILSIMKFKKTSVIGVIFTLTLVLAVTVAFASEPKDDVYDNEKVGTSVSSTQAIWIADVEGTQDVHSDLLVVDPEDVDLDEMRERLAQRVAGGEMTQAAADYELARVEEMLEPARRGELKLAMDEDGGLYGMGVGHLVQGEDIGGGYFRAEDGTLYCQNEDGSWAKIDINQYEVRFPTFDEDGNPENNGIVGRIGAKFYDFKTVTTVTDSDAVSGGVVGSIPGEEDIGNIEGAKWSNDYYIDGDGVACLYDDDGSLIAVCVPRSSTGAYELCRADDCAVSYDHCHIDGTVVRVYYEDPYADPGPVPSAGPEPTTAQPLVNTAPSTSCGVEGCTETRYHAHNEGRVILLSDPCPVEGCTITGNHIHGDTCYSCNGAGHSGGYCDGSCYTYNQPDTTSTSAHHSESHHSSGHH